VLDIIEGIRGTSQPCLLLVNPKVQQLDELARDLLSTYDWARLSIGQELSATLLAETPQRRPLTAGRWMKTRIRDLAPGPVLCTEIDLLFEPALSLSPLGLFKDAGRITRLVVTWPGTYEDDVLAYAVPDHSRYRTWRRPEVAVACMIHSA
jgi:hypothetical protein